MLPSLPGKRRSSGRPMLAGRSGQSWIRRQKQRLMESPGKQRAGRPGLALEKEPSARRWTRRYPRSRLRAGRMRRPMQARHPIREQRPPKRQRRLSAQPAPQFPNQPQHRPRRFPARTQRRHPAGTARRPCRRAMAGRIRSAKQAGRQRRFRRRRLELRLRTSWPVEVPRVRVRSPFSFPSGSGAKLNSPMPSRRARIAGPPALCRQQGWNPASQGLARSAPRRLPRRNRPRRSPRTGDSQLSLFFAIIRRTPPAAGRMVLNRLPGNSSPAVLSFSRSPRGVRRTGRRAPSLSC